MATIIQEFNLDLFPGRKPPVAHVSQKDKGSNRIIRANIFLNGEPYTMTGLTATVEGTNPAGGGFINVACTIGTNYAQFALTDDMTAVKGNVRSKIIVKDGTTTIGTGAFILAVDAAGVEGETIANNPNFEDIVAEAAIQALTDTGNELFKDSFTYRGELTSSDDMNDVRDPGYYYLPAGGCVNGAGTDAARILIFNRTTTTAALAQMWISIPTGRMHLRSGRSVNGSIVWTDWAAGGDHASLTYRPDLTASDDMDNVLKPGYYRKPNGVEVAHGVNAYPARILVVNQGASTVSLVQIWIDTNSNKLYLRTARAPGEGLGWSDWAVCGDPTAMVYRGQLQDGASIDDANMPGVYYKENGDELVGGVNSNGTRILNLARTSATFALAQLWFDTRANAIYLRSSRNPNLYGWSDFAELATVDKVAAMIAGDASAADSVKAFLELENSKAKALGANDTIVKVPSGLNWRTTSTALDLAKIAIAADANPTLSSIWGVDSYTITTRNASPRTISIETTVADATLEAAYTLLGGKTGHLAASSTHDEVCNLMAVCRKNGIKVAGAIMGATSTAARFTAMKELMDAAYDVIANGSTSKTVTSAQYAAAIRIDTGTTVYTQGANVEYQTASTIKTLTVLTVLDYIDDLDEVCTIDADDIRTGSGNVFNAGDMVTIRDLIYAAMLPSSNTAAMALAHYVGAKLINRRYADAVETEARFAALEARVAALENA